MLRQRKFGCRTPVFTGAWPGLATDSYEAGNRLALQGVSTIRSPSPPFVLDSAANPGTFAVRDLESQAKDKTGSRQPYSYYRHAKCGNHCRIISRACVNSGMSDQQVIKDFTPAMSSLILRKREALRNMLTEIDMKLLMFKSPSGDSASHDVAVLEVRERISKHLRIRQRGPWSKYACAYSDIGFYLNDYDDGYGVSKEQDDIYSTVDKIQRKAFEIIGPLYDGGLWALCKKREVEGDGSVVPDVDYRCIEVLDGDLPWNTGL